MTAQFLLSPAARDQRLSHASLISAVCTLHLTPISALTLLFFRTTDLPLSDLHQSSLILDPLALVSQRTVALLVIMVG
jgi:hypothetical protein